MSDENTPQPSDALSTGQTGLNDFERLRLCRNFRAGDILASCAASGALELADALKKAIAENDDFIKLELVHCMGRCHMGPTLKLVPAGPFLQGVQAQDVPHLIRMLKAGNVAGLIEAFPATRTDP